MKTVFLNLFRQFISQKHWKHMILGLLKGQIWGHLTIEFDLELADSAFFTKIKSILRK